MATNEDILLRAQAAIESVRGTDLAATRKVYAQITPSVVRPLSPFRNTTGTFKGRRRPSYARTKVSLSAMDEATYQDLPWWLQGCLKGGVTGVGDGGSPIAYTYTFLPTAATDDLASYTFEIGDVGNPYQTSQAMVNSWTLRMDSDNDAEPSWMLDLQLISRDWGTTTFTAALTDRTTEAILARGTKIYVDTSTIGSTQLTGKLISASITGNNNLTFKSFAEDVTYVAANKVGRGEQTIDAQFTFEFDDNTEFANYLSTVPVQRKIRFEQSGGTAIHTTVFPRMRVDLYGYWSSWSRGTRVNNLTATFGLMAFYDSTATSDIVVAIVNSLITLP
jgi:hypothetical protein